ncbi:MAG: STAS domain-containing protein [Desulfobulbaceae bacterium]|nr:STAS domain-containing protein [Desulfobulbaceae bacterium]
MKIETNKNESVTTISLTGRFDATVVGRFKEFLNSLSPNGTEQYVVDLANLQYIDSSGLGCLVFFLRQVRQNGGEIKISTISGKVRAVFELTKLHRIFEIYDDSSTAVKSYAMH